MALDGEICRIYKCHNKMCGCKISVVQKLTDDWLTTCPFCHQEELYVESGKMSLSVAIDTHNPKTLGMLASKNTESKLKTGEITHNSKQRPWWRKKDKVDFDVLKKPDRYIFEGKK